MAELTTEINVPTMHYPSVGPGINAWFGIRYAEVPGRFDRAQPSSGRLRVEHLSQVPVFPQKPSRLNTIMGVGGKNPQSEEAHFLNIWAPEHADNLPVMFFIHGGAWMTGGGSQEWYDGARLAALGMIVVTVNYRLGPFGHLGDQSDLELPLPLDDLLVALTWVRDEIVTYGGNPDRITVVGQSAGGWYGHVLSMLDTTRGLIHQVAHLSMGTRDPWSQDHQKRIHHLTANAAAPAELARMPAHKLLSVGLKGLQDAQTARLQGQLAYAGSGYLPVSTPGMPDGFLDPKQAALNTQAHGIYLRWTKSETAAFFWDSLAHVDATQEQVDAELQRWPVSALPSELVQFGRFDGASSGMTPYQQLVAASSWNQFQRFPAEFARHLEEVAIPTQVHRFTYESPLPNLHSAHCFDLPFQFGNWEAWQDAPMLEGISQDDFDEISGDTMRSLADFILQEHGC